MPKTDEKDGVWRTIGGRRVFIKNGQSVSDAMKESGKFKSASKTKADTSNNVKEETTKKERTYEDVDKEWKEQASKMEKNYDEFGSNTAEDEKKLNELSAERDRLSINRDEEHLKTAKDNQSSGEKFRQQLQEDKVKTFGDEIKESEKGQSLLEKHDLKDHDASFKRMMLSRMQSDNEYFLGNGNRNERHLWAKNPEEHIGIMKELYNSLPENERPDWLSMKDIENYEKQMIGNDSQSNNGQKVVGSRENNIEGSKIDRTDAIKLQMGQGISDDKLIDYANRNKSTNKKMNDAIRVKASRSSLYKSRPESKEIESQGTSNRKEVSNNIQAHILDYYDSPKDFVEQMEAMHEPNMWRAGEKIAQGGGYLIYNGDMSDFLNELKINPKGKNFSEDKAFDMYTSLIGRESARLYEKLKKEESQGRSFNDSLRRKAYEKYLKEHPASKLKFNEFVKKQ